MRKLLQSTAQYAIRYLEGLDARKVAPTEVAIANLIQFDEPLPNEPVEPELVLQLLDQVGSPASMAQAGSRFFGLVTGGSLPAALAANWLATAWDQNCRLYRITPATALLEQVALRWLLDVLHLPAECGGAFVTGATVAKFTAVFRRPPRCTRTRGLECRSRRFVWCATHYCCSQRGSASKLVESAGIAGARSKPSYEIALRKSPHHVKQICQ